MSQAFPSDMATRSLPPYFAHIVKVKFAHPHLLIILTNNKKRSHTQLDSRKQVIAFQDRVITINIKEAQHPLKCLVKTACLPSQQLLGKQIFWDTLYKMNDCFESVWSKKHACHHNSFWGSRYDSYYAPTIFLKLVRFRYFFSAMTQVLSRNTSSLASGPLTIFRAISAIFPTNLHISGLQLKLF